MKIHLLLYFFIGFCFSGYAQPLDSLKTKNELYLLSLEDLKTGSATNRLNLEVTTATKQAVRLAEVPSVMTVITRQDIETYGYTNLIEALSRVPEVYAHYNGHNYSADFRGFFTNNTERRVLYLINGDKLNDRFHFGDFYPDVIADLSNVERIEVIRGAGAALYGNNSVLGVVNIITRKPQDGAQTSLGVQYANLKERSGIPMFTLSHQGFYGKDTQLNLYLNWYGGSTRYNTQTNWQNNLGTEQNGISTVNFGTEAYFSADNGTSQDAFYRGNQLPNANIELNKGAFTVGTYLYTRRVSWVWPKDNATFNHPDNDRTWGTYSAFVGFAPLVGKLAKWNFSSRISYNINTNKEVADFDLEKSRPRLRNAVFANAYSQDSIANKGQAAFLSSQNGFEEYVSNNVSAAALSDSALLANGGGSRFVYHGADRVWSAEIQMNPVQKEKWDVLIGMNANLADYDNYQRYTYRNNKFIGWARWGGISAEGYTFGTFSQVVYRPIQKLTLTAGLRYDYQLVKNVFRQLGGKLRYSATAWENGIPTAFRPILAKDRVANDLTPRLAVTYEVLPNSFVKVLFGQAFRAVPSQEINRLPLEFGDAESEKTTNYEIVWTSLIKKRLNLSINGFYLEGNRIYQWNPSLTSFNAGSGWQNMGTAIDAHYFPNAKLEVWSNFTAYRLRRPSDAYPFMRDATGKALPNTPQPLESPQILFKVGGSHRFGFYTSLAAEWLYNGQIKGLYPARANQNELFYLHTVPASNQLNMTFTQQLNPINLTGWTLMFRIENLLNSTVWDTLPSEAEGSWSESFYEKPHQLPSLGRMFHIRLTAQIN